MQTGDQCRILSARLLWIPTRPDGRSSGWFAKSLKELAAAPTGKGRRGTAYAGMDLQPSAKDCIRLQHGWREGGREGMERTGVGGKWSETKTASIAIRSSNKVVLRRQIWRFVDVKGHIRLNSTIVRPSRGLKISVVDLTMSTRVVPPLSHFYEI